MFVRAANPIWYMVDHVGQPLNDEYYAFFLTNTLPYLPQNVYRDPQGMTVWTGDIVQFSPAGTLPDNLYFDPDLVYRIEIRHGNSQTDELIWEINNFVPGQGSSTNNELAILANDNQISNPQFAYINFVSPLTIATAGTYNIAPGWDLVLAGTGSTTVTQNILSGSQNITNSPPFSLRFNNSGWTTATLRQRFNRNGSIWANGAVTMQLTGRAQTTSQLISMVYSPSTPGTPQVVASGTLTTGDYQVIEGAVDIVASTNTTLNDTAYTDILINLPATGIVDLSNIQVIGQGDPLPSDFNPVTDIPLYQQQSEEREQDHLFHFYSDSLITQPKNSILVGWNFSLNPFQFNPTALTNVPAQTAYIADQTIIYQETAASLQSGKGASATLKGGLEITPIAAQTHTRFALIQYIDPKSILPYWGDNLSSLVKAKYLSVSPIPVTVKVRLIYRSNLPSTISPTEPIASWALGSDPVFSAGWTAIAPLNDPAYTLSNGVYTEFSYDQFELPVNASSNMTLGIVVYTMDRMSGVASPPDSITFDKISLVQNDFAIDTPPETYDECLRSCQFYYEKSYSDTDLPGTITPTGQFTYPMRMTSTANLNLASFTLNYKQVKRTTSPTFKIYAPDTGTINTMTLAIYKDGAVVAPGIGAVTSGAWQIGALSESAASFICQDTTTVEITATTPSVGNEPLLLGQYVIDARLGV